MSNAGEFVTELSIWALPIMFAIILHEVMHGFVALQLGDDSLSISIPRPQFGARPEPSRAVHAL